VVEELVGALWQADVVRNESLGLPGGQAEDGYFESVQAIPSTADDGLCPATRRVQSSVRGLVFEFVPSDEEVGVAVEGRGELALRESVSGGGCVGEEVASQVGLALRDGRDREGGLGVGVGKRVAGGGERVVVVVAVSIPQPLPVPLPLSVP
jgi:hypothetical protein